MIVVSIYFLVSAADIHAKCVMVLLLLLLHIGCISSSVPGNYMVLLSVLL